MRIIFRRHPSGTIIDTINFIAVPRKGDIINFGERDFGEEERFKVDSVEWNIQSDMDGDFVCHHPTVNLIKLR